MKSIFFTLIVTLLSACSLGQRTPNPELAQALVFVSADYLRHIVNNDEPKIGNAILWQDFLQTNELDKKQYLWKLAKLNRQFPKSKKHPLVGLSVTAINWEENNAQVYLRKTKVENAPEIKIDLLWGSNSWLVVDDNLFGNSELIDSWTKR